MCAATNSYSRSVPPLIGFPDPNVPTPFFPSRTPFGLPSDPPISGPTIQQSAHPLPLSAAGWKTQSFIHLFPSPLLCSLLLLVNITSPVGTLRGSKRCRAHKSKQSTFRCFSASLEVPSHFPSTCCCYFVDGPFYFPQQSRCVSFTNLFLSIAC